MGTGVPVDWYRTSFAPNFQSLYWEEGGEEKVALALAMLEPDGHERVLDLACATGQRTLELCRRGFDVVGVDIRDALLEAAAGEAQIRDLWPYFVEEDPRYLDFKQEFDLVLSLGGGSFEHFDYDEENLRAFESVARALRPGGRLLMQIPNVLHVEAHLPEKGLDRGGGGGGADRAALERGDSPHRRHQDVDPHMRGGRRSRDGALPAASLLG